MKANNKLIKLNLGSGKDHREGYINIDARDGVGVDLVHDITHTFPYKDGTVSEIVAQDVFEHLTLQDQRNLFKEIFRLIAPGGKIFIRIPNNDAIWKKYKNDPEVKNLFLFGDTSTSGVLGAHKSGHTLESFAHLAKLEGFKLTKSKKSDTNFELEFIREQKTSFNKIYYINQCFSLGGAENYICQLLANIKKDHKVEVWTNFGPFQKMLSKSGLMNKNVPFAADIIGDWKGLLKSVIYAPLLFLYYGINFKKINKSSVVLISGFAEKIFATPWAKMFDIPVVWIEYGPLESVFSKFVRFPKFLYRLVSRMPDYVIEPTENTRIRNLNIMGVSSARTLVVPCGIESLTKKKIGRINHSAYSVSRLEEGKGQDLLIKAWVDVVKKYKDAKLYLIGQGDFETKLKDLVKKLKLDDSVLFLGWVEDISKTVSPISINVSPSVWELEGFGLVLLEAMTLGKPIICFDAPPYNEIVNKDCAVLVEKGNTIELSKAIIKVFSDTALSTKLVRNAGKRFNDLYAIERITYKYCDIFDRAFALHLVKEDLKNV